MGRTAALVAFLSFLPALLAPAAQAGDRIYWANASLSSPDPVPAFGWAELDGSAGGALSPGFGLNRASGIVLDSASGRLYATDQENNRLVYVNLDGSGGAAFAPSGATINAPTGLAIDCGARRLYWTSFNANKISYANLDGSDGHDLAVGDATTNGPTGIALDPRAGRLFWVNYSAVQYVAYFNLNSGVGRDVPTQAGFYDFPVGLAIDPTGHRIYWANSGHPSLPQPRGPHADTIAYTRLDGTQGGTLTITGATRDQPGGIAIDPAARRLFWANINGNAISYVDLASGTARDIATPDAPVHAPNFVALLKAPVPDGEPVVSGGLNPGSVLSCAATWAPDLPGSQLYRSPQSATYQWTRGGAPIPGATGTTYAAAAGGEYRCTTTASNAAGSNTATSAPHTVLALPDYTDPAIAKLKVKPAAFKATKGAQVTYTLSEAARTKFMVERKNGKRYLAMTGSLSRSTGPGASGFKFNGRLRGRALSPGAYRLSARAEDLVGNQSATAKSPFRILR